MRKNSYAWARKLGKRSSVKDMPVEHGASREVLPGVAVEDDSMDSLM